MVSCLFFNCFSSCFSLFPLQFCLLFIIFFLFYNEEIKSLLCHSLFFTFSNSILWDVFILLLICKCITTGNQLTLNVNF